LSFAKDLAYCVGRDVFLPAYNAFQKDKSIISSDEPKSFIDFETKSGNPSDLVTKTDRALEKIIKDRLKLKYPSHK
jgi:fructose-1,6-bisphosphatase/inositol monophosphatase family enzyme